MQKGHRWGRKHEQSARRGRGDFFTSCECPSCGYKMSGGAAVPCSSIPCPQCGVPMVESN